jgi:hypothetical protein
MITCEVALRDETYENAELVEQLGGAVVVTAAVLELAEVVECVDHLACDAVVLLEVVQIGHLVAAEVVHDLLVGQEILDLAALLLEFLPLGQGVLPLLHILLRSLAQAVDLSVQVSHEVGHVCLLEELELEPCDVGGGRVVLKLLQELQQREDQVTVQVGDEFGQDAVLLCDIPGRLRLGGSSVGHVAGSGGLEVGHVVSVRCVVCKMQAAWVNCEAPSGMGCASVSAHFRQ